MAWPAPGGGSPAPSPPRSCVLGTMAFSSGRLAEARAAVRRGAGAGTGRSAQPAAGGGDRQPAGYCCALAGDAEKVQALGRWALGTGCLDAAAASHNAHGDRGRRLPGGRTARRPGRAGAPGCRPGPGRPGRRRRPVVPWGVPAAGRRPGPGHQRPDRQPQDGTVGRHRHRWSCAPTSTWRWPSTWPARGMTCCSPRSRDSRRRDPYPHLRPADAAPGGRVRAGRAGRGRGGRTARGSWPRRRRPAWTTARKRCTGRWPGPWSARRPGDYLGMADALGPWQDETALDSRSRVYAVLWLPLLAERRIGSGQLDQATTVLDAATGRQWRGRLPAAPWPGWRDGWPSSAATRSRPGRSTAAARTPPAYTARCTRPGCCWPAAPCCAAPGTGGTRSNSCGGPDGLYQALRAAPFIARTEEELTTCHLPGSPAKKQSGPGADQPGDRSSSPGRQGTVESRDRGRAVHQPQGRGIPPGQHLRQVRHAGRQQLRHFVEQWRQPATV